MQTDVLVLLVLFYLKKHKSVQIYLNSILLKYYYTVDFALGATLLGISCVTLIVSFVAAVFAGLSAGVCLGPKSPLMRISDFEKQNKNAANKPNNPSRYTQPQQI
jgi:hypothetical protein